MQVFSFWDHSLTTKVFFSTMFFYSLKLPVSLKTAFCVASHVPTTLAIQRAQETLASGNGENQIIMHCMLLSLCTTHSHPHHHHHHHPASFRECTAFFPTKYDNWSMICRSVVSVSWGEARNGRLSSNGTSRLLPTSKSLLQAPSCLL